jgi:hypothetical protein
MPNVTISVPDDLKEEMDKLSREVSWSEICRKAISRYLVERKNPVPRIEIDYRISTLNVKDWQTGYPTLKIDLKIFNHMASSITTDRILSVVTFWRYDERFPVGTAYDFDKRVIGANLSGGATVKLILLKEKIQQLQDKFTSTFDCRADCTVYVEDFNQPYRREISFKIPIDIWQDIIKKSLEVSNSE